jgi:hypothetical protein
VANTLKLLRTGAVGFIDWLDLFRALPHLALRPRSTNILVHPEIEKTFFWLGDLPKVHRSYKRPSSHTRVCSSGNIGPVIIFSDWGEFVLKLMRALWNNDRFPEA